MGWYFSRYEGAAVAILAADPAAMALQRAARFNALDC